MIANPIKAIFFDLDDTLCGYWDAAKAGLRDAIRENLPEHDVEEVVSAWVEEFRGFCPNLRRLGLYETYLEKGETTRTEVIQRMLQRLGIDDAELGLKVSQRYGERRDQRLTLFPEVVPLLQRLKSQYRLGLITNGPADIQRQEVETLNLTEFFDPIYIEGELGFGKPDPRIFEMAMKATGTAPTECAMVGNSYHHDMMPAMAAGWHTYWVRRPSDIPPTSKTGEIEGLPDGAEAPCMTAPDLHPLEDWILEKSGLKGA